MPLVEMKGLAFSYSSGPEIISVPQFKLESGERLFLHGPSGSGKTTFLGIIAGVLSPSRGEISILGKYLGKMSGPQRDRFRADHLGIIFQQFNLVPYLSVLENVMLAAEVSIIKASRLQEKSLKAEALRLLRSLEMESVADKSVLNLSVGQQQRVAVARAMIGSPELIIADEPTSALDSDLRAEFLKLLFEQVLAAKSGLIFVSHDRGLANEFDRSLSLSEVSR